MRNILVINPGSTSTKVAVFVDGEEQAASTAVHSPEELAAFASVADQARMREERVRAFVGEQGISLGALDAVVARGGLLRPIAGGLYGVNESMLADLRTARYGEHASNLGAMIAHSIAAEAGCGAFVADPVVVDEMEDVARISGLPWIVRRSIFHALNQKSVASRVAAEIGREYSECNFIVAHMGGGISVGAHRGGRVVDVNNALDGDGPFSPERSGGLPVKALADLCFEGQHAREEIGRMITGQGGLVAYRGTNRLDELRSLAGEGDAEAQLLCEALAYQISKEIAMHGATLSGEVDRIILTGGLAHDEVLVGSIRERVSFLAPVEVVPGEREMQALVESYLAAADGREQVKEYVNDEAV